MIMKCHMCGKPIDLTVYSDYTYKKLMYKGHKKTEMAYFCGWNHMREYEIKEEKKKWRKTYQ